MRASGQALAGNGLGEQRVTQDLVVPHRQKAESGSQSSLRGDGCSLDLFRRAVVYHDDNAWAFLYRQYEPLLHTLVSQHPQASSILPKDEYSSVINSAFAILALEMTPAQLQRADQHTALLRSLRNCVHRAICQEIRIDEADRLEVSFQVGARGQVVPDPADSILSHLSEQQLWQLIAEILPEKQAMVLVLMYGYGFKPAEIASCYRQSFSSSQTVYRVKHAAVQRLLHSRRLHRYLRELRPHPWPP